MSRKDVSFPQYQYLSPLQYLSRLAPLRYIISDTVNSVEMLYFKLLKISFFSSEEKNLQFVSRNNMSVIRYSNSLRKPSLYLVDMSHFTADPINLKVIQQHIWRNIVHQRGDSLITSL